MCVCLCLCVNFDSSVIGDLTAKAPRDNELYSFILS